MRPTFAACLFIERIADILVRQAEMRMTCLCNAERCDLNDANDDRVLQRDGQRAW